MNSQSKMSKIIGVVGILAFRMFFFSNNYISSQNGSENENENNNDNTNEKKIKIKIKMITTMTRASKVAN